MLRILTDRGTEYFGRVESHDYQLHLAINDIEHTRTKVKSPQTNGIYPEGHKCERFHKTILQGFYQVTLIKHVYDNLAALQKHLDEWLEYYNNDRTPKQNLTQDLEDALKACLFETLNFGLSFNKLIFCVVCLLAAGWLL